jgi:hypothetical protein
MPCFEWRKAGERFAGLVLPGRANGFVRKVCCAPYVRCDARVPPAAQAYVENVAMFIV